MDNPELYAETNYNQYKDVKDLIREYQNEFTWNENEKILDIGCGPGNVTSELLLPIIPKSSYLLGVDVSNEMVNFAKKNYKDGRLGFTTLNIEADNVIEVLGEEDFDKIFSFYCLHWVHDYRKVAENLWKLMKPNGCALLVFLQSSSLYSMYEWLSTQPKWKEYMLDVNNYISVYQKTNNPSEKYRNLLENVGFKVIHCYVKEASVSLPTCEAFKKTMKALNPFINRMPNDLHDEYLDCIMKTAVNKGFIKVDSTKEYEILSDITPNKLLITFCQKIV